MQHLCATLLLLGLLPLTGRSQSDGLPRGANQLPYQRYESENATRGGAATLQSSPQFVQGDIASEASNQQYVSLPTNGSYVEWTVQQASRGFNLRFTMPDANAGAGQSGSLGLYVNGTKIRNINLSSYWAFQYFNTANSDPKQDPAGTDKTFMRFDEVHFRIDTTLNPNDKLRIQKDNGDAITYGVDFVELEPVPAALTQPVNYLSVTDYGANGNDNTDDLAAFNSAIAAAASQGKNVWIPQGRFILSNKLLLNVNNVKIMGAGIWYTYIYFSTNVQFSGGILARASNVEISNISMNTANNAREVYGGEPNPLGQIYKVYKGFMGTYGNNSYIHDVWVEHFECGFWIGGYDPPYPVDATHNLLISHCRIRNNYADGVNFSQGTNNSTVEQSSIRNSGDDGLAVWPATDAGNTVNAINNTFRNNTIENVWRAGGIAIFGGTGHNVHHNIVKDGVAGSAIRFTNDFSGFTFQYPGDVINVAENSFINCGTSYDLWNQKRGAVEFYANTGIFNLQFDNNDITNAQRDGVQVYGNNIHHLILNNTTINGTGKDTVTRNVQQDVYGGFGIYAQANSDSMVFNNLTVTNAESGTSLNRNTSFHLIIRNANIPVTGIALTPNADTTIGQSQSFVQKFTLTPVDATSKSITWSSSNTAAVTVDSSGRITAVGLGTANITATTQNGLSSTRKITVTPAVTITSTDSDAGEGGNTASFKISTTGISQNVTVAYTLSGTATAADYTASPALTGTVVLTPTALSQTITITPVDDNVFEGPETLRIAIKSGSGYQLGSDTVVTINIADNDNPPCVSPVVARVSGTAPVIDQTIDAAWNVAPSRTISNVTIGSGANLSGKWRALYDNTNLYVLAEVNDITKMNDSGGNWWEDDAVEIFIDGDNSKTATYDGANDFQLGFRWNDNTVHVGGNSVTRTTGINFSMYATGTGYNLEAVIPWSTIGVTPSIGKPIGFEVQIDNDNDGGTRDAQIASFATGTTAFQDPRVFGTVYLTSCTGTNQPPTANAGPDQALTAGTTTATLTGTGSDPEGKPVTYQWTQVSGPTATITSATSATATVSGLSNNNTYVFQLAVTDDASTTTDQVQITVASSNVAVTGVTVSPATASMAIGGTQQLTPTVAPSNATNKNVSYSSSNTGIATVNSTGLVTGVAAGTATITVTTADGAKTATAAITVTSGNVAVTGVTLAPATASLTVGGTQQLTATVAPSNATNKNVSYSSSATAVATVNSTGLVTAIAAGTATITVTTADGAKTAASTITVTNPTGVTYYRIKNRWQNTYLKDGGTQVPYAATPGATDQLFQWSLEDVGGGYYEIKNRSTGEYLHIEHLLGYVECTARTVGWMSSRWATESTGDGYVRFRNAWQSSCYIHNQDLTGYAEYGTIYSAWASAQWQLETVAAGSRVGGIVAQNGKANAISIAAPTTETADIPADLQLYPNPAQSTVTLQAKGNLAGGTVTIYNNAGTPVSMQVISTPTLTVSQLPAGVYTLIYLKKGTRIVKRFVKLN
ncbi:T9SS C-terminal target domain-containing protein [Deminuibacter soli]|uniref:T9SS C-terminal target domain-containing protein n=2 Tax=Deminuibacter soli TaxID=2291815 RepID=A0A3E1NJV0_9BACT|nr:T9SS C-terminal target domain-containing protein [Deminuibacter soli]